MAADRYVFKARKLRCRECGTASSPLLWCYDEVPRCPCGGQNEPDYGQTNKAPTVIQDSIEGGVMIEHGICNADASPRRYYSKGDIRAAARAKGLEQHVVHVPEQGSDKSPHTTRWI